MGVQCSTCVIRDPFNPNRGVSGGDRIETLVITRPSGQNLAYYDNSDIEDEAEALDNLNVAENIAVPSVSSTIQKRLSDSPMNPHISKKALTSDTEKKSTPEESVDLSYKKTVSFSMFSNGELKSAAVTKKYTHPKHGTAWDIHNLKLIRPISTFEKEFLWEAETRSESRKCAVRLTLVESSQLRRRDVTKAELILRQLSLVESLNVAQIYSFGVFEHQIFNKPYMIVVVVQETGGYSLAELHSYKVSHKEKWKEEELMWILSQIYKGLVSCKESSIIHGNLTTENAFLSEDLNFIVLKDFDLRLPKDEPQLSGRRVPAAPKKKSHFLKAKLEEAQLAQGVSLDSNDLRCLTNIMSRLASNEEDQDMISRSSLGDDEHNQNHNYLNVQEMLKKILEKRPLAEIKADFEEKLKNFNHIESFAWAEKVPRKIPAMQPMDLLLHKIDIYRWINNANAVIQEFFEAIKAYKENKTKFDHDYHQYIKCGNKIIKQYIELKDYLQARDLSVDLNNQLKTDEEFKRALKHDPEEYINFTLLMGNIYENLRETDKAIESYSKGIKHCISKKIKVEEYQPSLKRLVVLLLEKDKHEEALEYLKNLVSEDSNTERGGYEGADAYMVMGNIVTNSGRFKQAIRYYQKAMEIVGHGPKADELLLKLYEKMIVCYIQLNDDDRALEYELEVLNLKKMIYGKQSLDYIRHNRKVAEIYTRAKNPLLALKHYEIYYTALKELSKSLPTEYAESMMYLGDAYSSTNQHDKAITYYLAYGEFVKKVEGMRSRKYLKTLDSLAQAYFKKHLYKKALDVQLSVLEMKKDVYGKGSLDLVISFNNIGDTYYMMNKYDKSLEYHLKCLESLPMDSARELAEVTRQQMWVNIAMDYKKLGNYGKGLEYMYEGFQVKQGRGVGLDTENIIEVYDKLSDQAILSLNFKGLSREVG